MTSAPKLAFSIIPVTPLQQNCTLVWNEHDRIAAVIDPGGEVDKILAQIDKYKLNLVKILVTHGHVDHVGAVADLQEQLQLPVEGPHRDDQFWIDRVEADGLAFGIGKTRGFTTDRWLDHGDKVEVGDLIFDVFHCPGHSPGHVVFYHAPSKWAQVGDVIFRQSIGRTDFPRSSHQALINSIRNHLFPLGDDIYFVPGHGMPSSFGEERRSNPFVADHISR